MEGWERGALFPKKKSTPGVVRSGSALLLQMPRVGSLLYGHGKLMQVSVSLVGSMPQLPNGAGGAAPEAKSAVNEATGSAMFDRPSSFVSQASSQVANGSPANRMPRWRTGSLTS